jgi:hypothetical protein
MPLNYEIVEAVQLKDELPCWLITYQGFQVGGEVDRSGAGNLTFYSYAEATDYLHNFLITARLRDLH